MAKIIVTGGAGFIGSHIIDQLLALGHEITVIDNLSSGQSSNLDSRVQLHQLDIRSEEAAQVVYRTKPAVLVHAAAQISVRVSMEQPAEDASVNVVGFVNLLHALRSSPGAQVVFLSTGGAIYGEQEYFPADENHPLRPTSIYGQSKRVAELYLDFFAREFNLKSTILRLANVYGPRQSAHGEAGVIAIFLTRLISGQKAVINGTGEQTRDFVYVKDVAQAAVQVITQRIGGVFNISTGVETSVNQLVKLLLKAYPDKSDLLSHGPAKGGEQLRSVIDSKCANQTFGWKAEVDISKGMQATTDWFAKQII